MIEIMGSHICGRCVEEVCLRGKESISMAIKKIKKIEKL
jgi:hypothetical protein